MITDTVTNDLDETSPSLGDVRVIVVRAVNPDYPDTDPCHHYHVLAQQHCGCEHILGMAAAAEHCPTAAQRGDCVWSWRYGWGGFDETDMLATPAQAKQLADALIRAGSTNPGIGSGFRHPHPYRPDHQHIDVPFNEVTPDTLWILSCDEHCVFDFMLCGPLDEIGEPYWTAGASA